MFFKTRTYRSTVPSSAPLAELKAALAGANAVVIGAGSGLSTAAGSSYAGTRFDEHFADFRAKYGIQDMYSGGFYPFETPEEQWAYWSRHILLNRYAEPPGPLYRELLALVADKDYFVLTTNVDHCFQKAGFDKARLFYTQGDYGLFQCSRPCCQETWDNEDVVRQMAAQQRDMKIPADLVPRCPHCGAPAVMNLRCDDTFVEDGGWHTAAERYADFLKVHAKGRVLFLELGVGYNTPGIIKYPFWRMTLENPAAVYACVNRGEALVPPQLGGQAISIDGDLAQVVRQLSV